FPTRRSSDLKLAGIPKRDDRGRTLDLHALRHTFGTLLSKGGVAPRTAQAAMRHADIGLTMNVYTDPRLLDIRGALEALPTLPLNGTDQQQQSTGTTDLLAPSLAPMLAPTSDNSRASLSFSDKLSSIESLNGGPENVHVSAESVKRRDSLTTAVHECPPTGGEGLEPSASSFRGWRSPAELPSKIELPTWVVTW